jgi:hypothetical protein
VPEAIELLGGAAMRDEPGRLPPLEAPAAPTGATWELGQARQRFAMGELQLDVKFVVNWLAVLPEVDGRAGPFVGNALQRQLNEAAAALPSVRRLPGLEAAVERAAARDLRRQDLEARRASLLGAQDLPDDLGDRLAAIDTELAGLASTGEVCRRLTEQLDAARLRANRDASMVSERLNREALDHLLGLRDAAALALTRLPGVGGALLDLVTAIRLCESASASRLGNVQAALAAARAAAPQGPQDGPQGGQGDAGGSGPGPEPTPPPDAPQPTPEATAGPPEKTFSDYLTQAFEVAKQKAALEDAPPPPTATPTNRISGWPLPNGYVEPAPADDEADAPQLAEGEAADEIDAEGPSAGDLPDAPHLPDGAGPESSPAAPLAVFVTDRCTLGEANEVEVNTLLQAFNSWAAARGEAGIVGEQAQQKFGKLVRSVVPGVVVVRHQVGDLRPRYFRGIALRPGGA